MKKIVSLFIMILTLFSCSKDFLDNPPTTGLSNDKLVDLQSMQALIYGAYDIRRGYTNQAPLYAAAMVRDILVRNRPEYDQFFDQQLSESMTSWIFTAGYQCLGLLNTVAVSNVTEMKGNEDEKNAVLGDMHFLRALVYFELNNYFEEPATGYTIPLILKPLSVNDRVSCSRTEDVINTIENDIEQARTYFQNASGVADYYAATALAARIYFFHKKYDLAYDRANEVINSNQYALENDVAAPFVPGVNSTENIFTIKYNPTDGNAKTPTQNIFSAYQASESNGWFTLNPDGELAQLMLADTNDNRYKSFFTEAPPVTYIDGKYSTDQMEFIFIRLPEMYLTRAEADIMINNSVNQQDVDDINILRARADSSTILTSIPTVENALDILYQDRTKELAIESDDHYLNVRRLQRGIIKTAQEGGGIKPYSEYVELLVFPLPENEVKIHGLTRNP